MHTSGETLKLGNHHIIGRPEIGTALFGKINREYLQKIGNQRIIFLLNGVNIVYKAIP